MKRRPIGGIILVVIFAVFILISGIMMVAGGAEADSTMGFEVIDSSFGVTWIVYDVETGVMYAISHGSYNAGSATVMLNPDGTPRVWSGFNE